MRSSYAAAEGWCPKAAMTGTATRNNGVQSDGRTVSKDSLARVTGSHTRQNWAMVTVTVTLTFVETQGIPFAVCRIPLTALSGTSTTKRPFSSPHVKCTFEP